MDDTQQPPQSQPNPDETQVMDWSGSAAGAPTQPAGKTSLGVDPNAPIPGSSGTAANAAIDGESKKPTGLIVAVVILAIAVVGLLAWALLGRSSEPTPTATTIAPVTTVAQSTTVAPTTRPATTTAPTTRPATTTAPTTKATTTTTTTTSTTTTTTTTTQP